MILFETANYGELIKPVECFRANDKSVWRMVEKNGKVFEERSARYGHHTNFYDTMDEAKAALHAKYDAVIAAMKRRIDIALEMKEKVNAINN